ncbi:MAG: hypothetical protein IPO94_15735 [Saprospiraceae bacterium]|nr:hypothetical protein [Saprospiraceae bacterium]
MNVTNCKTCPASLMYRIADTICDHQDIKYIILLVVCFTSVISCKNEDFKTDTFYYPQLDKTIKIKIDKSFELMFADSLDLDSSYSIELYYRNNNNIKILHNIYSNSIYPKSAEYLSSYFNERIRCRRIFEDPATLKVLMCKNYIINDIPIFCSGAIIKPPEEVIEYISSYIDLIDTSHVTITTTAFTNSFSDTLKIKNKHFEFLNNVEIVKGKLLE